VSVSHVPGTAGEPDDRALLQAHVDGDPHAFGVLVHRHRDRLWGVALRTLGDREEAADALQDGLISAFRNAASYRGDAAVTTWLHRIVVNACLDRVRRRQARPSLPLGERDLPDRRDEHSLVDTRLDVSAALATLPEAQRAALILVDMEDIPVAEVARLLGVAEGTIKSRCSRGRTALAHLLRDRLAEPSPSGARTGNLPVVPRVASPALGTADPNHPTKPHNPTNPGRR
jgi:RNA polymerase sigma-70 factor, ECF subfamily